MENRIKAAFDQIHADEKTIRHTKACLREKSFDYGRDVSRVRRRRARLISTFAVLVLAFTGLGLYKLPAAAIDIDVNPSIELKINVFEKVVSAKGMNQDGKAIVEQLELENLKYTKALRRILVSDGMEEYLNGDELLSITVVGGAAVQNEELLRNVVCCANSVTTEENIYYCRVDADTARQAKNLGLTAARYLAYKQLGETLPEITAEDIRQMSMREIKDLLGCESLENPCDYIYQED